MMKTTELMKSWVGKKESDGSFKEIIDIYNSHTPYARGVKATYTMAWCAITISAMSIKLGLTDIIPTECGCERQIDLFKKLNEWVENDAYVPKEGDIIYYDWQDNGRGDNTGFSDHVGYVVSCVNNVITVIEGNKNDSVAYRTINVNAKYIRGFASPRYPKSIYESTSTKAISDFIERLYTIALGRTSDPIGKADWIDRVENRGYTDKQLVEGFLFSPEFLNKNLSNSEFLDILYKVFFNRKPDTAGKTNWLNAMSKGMSKKEVINGFLSSKEWENNKSKVVK